MKRAFVLLSLALFLTNISRSQVVGFRDPFANVGVKVGGTAGYIASAPLKSSAGPLAGIYARKGIGRFAVRIEAMGSYAQYKTKYPAAYYSTHLPGMDTVTAANFQVIYLNVPLLFEYEATKKLHLLLGPQFSYIVSITDKSKVYSGIYGNSNILTNTDFSVAAGVEYDLGKRMQLGARIIKGVVDVNNSTYYLVHKPWTSAGAQVSVSYRIL